MTDIPTKEPVLITITCCQQCPNDISNIKNENKGKKPEEFTCQDFGWFCKKLNAFFDNSFPIEKSIRKDCPLDKKDDRNDQRIYILPTHVCQKFEPRTDGNCTHYDVESYSIGTAHYCRHFHKLVDYIPDCPMSIEKCSEPEYP